MTTSRRDFVRALGVIAAAPALVGLTAKGRVIGGGFVPDGSADGHLLRDGTARNRLRTSATRRADRRVKVAIVGGGRGGLSAASAVVLLFFLAMYQGRGRREGTLS